MIPTYYHARTWEGSERMRGPDDQHKDMFSYIVPEARVRPDHPLRPIRQMTDAVFAALSPRFATMYSDRGGRRFPRSSSCARCCCSISTPSGVSGC